MAFGIHPPSCLSSPINDVSLKLANGNLGNQNLAAPTAAAVAAAAARRPRRQPWQQPQRGGRGGGRGSSHGCGGAATATAAAAAVATVEICGSAAVGKIWTFSNVFLTFLGVLNIFPGEASGPGFSLSGHKGFGDWTRFGNLSGLRILIFLSIGFDIDLDLKMSSKMKLH